MVLLESLLLREEQFFTGVSRLCCIFNMVFLTKTLKGIAVVTSALGGVNCCSPSRLDICVWQQHVSRESR